MELFHRDTRGHTRAAKKPWEVSGVAVWDSPLLLNAPVFFCDIERFGLHNP